MGTEEECLGLAIVEPNKTVLPVSDMVAKPDIEYDVAQVKAVKVKPEGVDDAIALVDDQQNGRRIAAASGLLDVDTLTTIAFAEFLFELAVLAIAKETFGVQIGQCIGQITLDKHVFSFVDLVTCFVLVNVASVEPLCPVFLARDIAVDATIPIGPGLFLGSSLIGNIMRTFHPRRTVLNIVITRQENMSILLPPIQLIQIPQRCMLHLRLNRGIIQKGRDMKQMLSDIAGPKLLPRKQVDQRCILKDVSRDLPTCAFGIVPLIRHIRSSGPSGQPGPINILFGLFCF